MIIPRLEKISPNWYHWLKSIRSVKPLFKKKFVRIGLIKSKLDITDFSSCMVGEANLWDRRNYLGGTIFKQGHKCIKCENLANKFNLNKKESPRINKIRIIITVRKFWTPQELREHFKTVKKVLKKVE